MAAALWPPTPEPAKVQLRRPMAMPRSARSAALVDRHIRPSSRMRVSAGERLGLQSIALASSLFGDSRCRCSRSQASSVTASGLDRSARTARLIDGGAVDLTLDREQVVDAPGFNGDGSFLSSAISESLHRACDQRAASTIGPGLRAGS